MGIYRTILDNDMCISIRKGTRLNTSVYFDVKEIIENAEKLKEAISMAVPCVTSFEELLDFVAIKKIASLADQIATISDETQKQVFGEVTQATVNVSTQFKVGDIIKYVNTNYAYIFDKSVSKDTAIKRDKQNVFFPMVEFCAQYQQGIADEVFIFLAHNHWHIFLYYFDELKKKLFRSSDIFGIVFSAANVLNLIQTRCEQLLDIAKSLKSMTWEEINLFEELNQQILSVALDIMKNAEERDTILYGDSIRRIRRYYSEINYDQEKLVMFEEYYKEFDKRLTAYMEKNGSVFSHSIPGDIASKIFESKMEWPMKQFVLTHSIKEHEIRSIFCHDGQTEPSLIDMVSHNIDTDEYFTFSRQQGIEIAAAIGSASILQVYLNDNYHEALIESMAGVVCCISNACGFQSESLVEELMSIDQILLMMVAANKKNSTINYSSLIYGACMLVIACIEKLLRLVYKFESHIILSDELIQLGGLVNNEIIERILTEDLMKATGFYLSKYEYIGLNYRNRLAHLSDIAITDISKNLPFTFFYFYLSILNGVFLYYCLKGE